VLNDPEDPEGSVLSSTHFSFPPINMLNQAHRSSTFSALKQHHDLLTMTSFLKITAFLLAFSGAIHGRTWTNKEGVQIDAEMAGVEGGKVLLRMAGKLQKVPLESLSAADQEFATKWQPTPAKVEVPQEAADKSSKKKGIGCGAKSKENFEELIKSLNLSWQYCWTPAPPDELPSNVEFVPMVFGKKDSINAHIERIKSMKRKEKHRYVLGYNEPDEEKQANLSVEAALAAWPKLMALDLPLVSPGAVHADNDWMEAFMKGVKERGYRVDFIAVHSYGNGDPTAFLDKLARIHKLYDRPLWITEFAVADWQASSVAENRYSPEDVQKFMKAVLPKLERLDYVYRYAWFPGAQNDKALGPSAIFDANGKLTKLGEIYAKHQ